MSDPHDKNAERLRRIRKVSEEADSKASAPEPATDVILQKIVQEMVTVRRQNDALTAQVKEMRQDHQRQSAEIAGLRSQLRSVDAGLNKQQEQLAQQSEHSIPSFTDIKTYIHDKLFASEVKLYCILGAILMFFAILWGWNQIKESKAEPQQPRSAQVSAMQKGKGK